MNLFSINKNGAILLVLLLAIVTIGTNPMIMAYGTDGGGCTRLYATSNWIATQTGSMSGSISSSGSCYFKTPPNNNGFGVYKWESEFTRTSDFRIRDIQSINVKIHGETFYLHYSIVLMYDHLDTGSWSGIWSKSYFLGNDVIDGNIPVLWQTKSWSYSETDTSSLIDVSNWGHHWKVCITVSVYEKGGYVCRTTSNSLSAYYNSIVLLL